MEALFSPARRDEMQIRKDQDCLAEERTTWTTEKMQDNCKEASIFKYIPSDLHKMI